MANKRNKRDDRLVARLTRGSQPTRRRAKGRRFSEENQPKRGRGRPKGARNYFTRNVQEALLKAVNRFGADGRGKDGLEGYFFKMCGEEPKSVMTMLNSTMPTRITVEQRPKRYRTLDEVRQELARYGMDLTQPALPNYKGPEIELDAEEITEPAGTETDSD
jgi:hypothetical protein